MLSPYSNPRTLTIDHFQIGSENSSRAVFEVIDTLAEHLPLTGMMSDPFFVLLSLLLVK